MQKLVLLMAHMMYALRLMKRMNFSRQYRQHLHRQIRHLKVKQQNVILTS